MRPAPHPRRRPPRKRCLHHTRCRQHPGRSRTPRHKPQQTLPRHGARIPKGPRRLLDRAQNPATIRPHRRKCRRRSLRIPTHRHAGHRHLPLHRRPRPRHAAMDPCLPTPGNRVWIRRRSSRRTGRPTPAATNPGSATQTTRRKQGLERSPPGTQPKRAPPPGNQENLIRIPDRSPSKHLASRNSRQLPQLLGKKTHAGAQPDNETGAARHNLFQSPRKTPGMVRYITSKNRKPKVTTRFPTLYPRRMAERRNHGMLLHEPPRNTRCPQSPPATQALPSDGAPA